MAKTIFNTGTIITKEFLNALNHPVYNDDTVDGGGDITSTVNSIVPSIVNNMVPPIINSMVPSIVNNIVPARNLLHNASFRVNQRGVSGTVTLSAGAFGHDRWKAGASGCTYTFSTTQGLTTITISAGSLVQTVDGLDLAAGVNTNTLSWGGTCQGKIGSGSYGASGITGLATGGTDINVEFGTGTLYEPQFEIGSAVSQFEYHDINDTHSDCQRYLPSVSGSVGSMLAAGQCSSATIAEFFLPFSVQPRISPTGISVSGLSYLHCSNAAISSTPTVSSLVFIAANQSGARIRATVAGGLVAGNAALLLVFGGTVGLIFTGAEL